MLEFLRRNRIALTGALGLLVAVSLALGTTGGAPRADRLGQFFLDLLVPFQEGAAVIGRGLGGVRQGIADVWRARTDNVALREQVQRQERALERVAEVRLENARLRRLLEFRETLSGDLIAARVVGYDATGLAQTLTLDRGARDGITKGGAVLAPEGAVGQVFLVGKRSARVLLIADHNGGVDALVRRTRVRGIVQGAGRGATLLKYVNRTEDVQVGDTVITSGLDDIFPKGVPVGEVVAVDKRGRGLFQHVEVRPRVDFARLEEVLVSRHASEGRRRAVPPS